jgi:putative FmdB family regulatory protein
MDLNGRRTHMPLYEYTCRTCGTTFEKRLRIDERLNAQVCPECGAVAATLRMSAPALVGSPAGAVGDLGVCPSTGAPCGCASAIRH